jgi:hypothetical protein
VRQRTFFAIGLFALSAAAGASTVTWVGDGSNGWTTGDHLDAANLDAIKAAVDDNFAHLTNTSTNTAVAKFAGTTGHLTNSGVLIDASNNVTIPGTLSTGSANVPSCLVMRNSANTGNVACQVVGTTFTCQADTNGTCGDGI